MNTIAIVTGTLVALYCIVPAVIGIAVQCNARKKDNKRESYGTLPGLSLVFHCIIMVSLLIALFVWIPVMLFFVAGVYILKIIIMLIV